MTMTKQNLNTYEETHSFLEQLNNTDLWDTIDIPNSTLKYIRMESIDEAENFCKNRIFPNIQKDESLYGSFTKGAFIMEEDDNGFAMINGKLMPKINSYLINDEIMMDLLDKMHIRCGAITHLLKKNKILDFCESVNYFKGNKFRSEVNEKIQILIRDNAIQAVFSSKYEPEPQVQLLETINDVIQDLVPTSTFESSFYQMDYSSFYWNIGDLNSDILKSFKNKMIFSGHSLNYSQNIQLSLKVETSDLGNISIRLTPIMKVDDREIPISSTIKFKHFKNAKRTVESVKEILSLVNDSIDNLVKLMSIDINHPYLATVAALKKIELHKQSIGLCNEILNEVIKNFGRDAKTDAFQLYALIANTNKYETYNNLSTTKKMLLIEKIYRLTQLNWAKADKNLVVYF